MESSFNQVYLTGNICRTDKTGGEPKVCISVPEGLKESDSGQQLQLFCFGCFVLISYRTCFLIQVATD